MTKKILTITVTAVALTFMVVAGVAAFFTYYGEEILKAQDAEESGTVIAEQNFLVDPQPREYKPIEVYIPFHREVVTSLSNKLRGRADADFVLFSSIGQEDVLLRTDDLGIFETVFQTGPGVHQLVFITGDADKEVQIHEQVLGMLPYTNSETKQLAMVGEVRTLSFDEGWFKVTTQDDIYEIRVGMHTRFYRKNANGEFNPAEFNTLQSTERVGIIARSDDELDYVADEVWVDYYPYHFYGQIREINGNEIVLERRNRVLSTVIMQPETRYLEWGVTHNLLPITADELQVGEYIFVSGYILPKGNRSAYYANQILLLAQIK